MQLNSSVTNKRVDCTALPKGWQREEVLRKSGISAGKVDVYYYSPSGKKIESKPQLIRQLGDAVDLSNFDFHTGKLTLSCSANAANALKRKYKSQTGAAGSSSSGSTSASSTNVRQQLEYSRALRTDVSLVPPIRQTASIFKQPVTVIRNHENNKVKHDTKNGAQEKPKQMFWEKRLERLRACHASGEEFDDIILPKGIRTMGPNVNEQTVLQSLATALHVLNAPVTGQTSTKTEFNKNATAFINPDQPLMQSVLITDDDIRRQEDRVSAARRKLQDALRA